MWFPDLSQSDPYYVFPALFSVLIWRHISYTASFLPPDQAGNMKLMATFFGLTSLPFMHMMSAGFNIYAISNVVSGMAMSAVMRNSGLRESVGLKKIVLPTERAPGAGATRILTGCTGTSAQSGSFFIDA